MVPLFVTYLSANPSVSTFLNDVSKVLSADMCVLTVTCFYRFSQVKSIDQIQNTINKAVNNVLDGELTVGVDDSSSNYLPKRSLLGSAIARTRDDVLRTTVLPPPSEEDEKDDT